MDIIDAETAGKICCAIVAWSDNLLAVKRVAASIELIPAQYRNICKQILTCRQPDGNKTDDATDVLYSIPDLVSVASYDLAYSHYSLALQAEMVLRKEKERETAATVISEAQRTLRDQNLSLADRLATIGQLSELAVPGPRRGLEKLLEDLKADPKPETAFLMTEELSLLSISEYAAFKATAKEIVKTLNRNDLDASVKQKRVKRRPPRKATESMLLNPDDPMETARSLVLKKYFKDNHQLLWWSQDMFYSWAGSCYVPVREKSMRAVMWAFLDSAKKPVWNKDAESFEEEDFDPDKGDVDNAMDALRAVVNLNEIIIPPAWIRQKDGDPPASEIVAFKNGLLHLPTMILYPPSPHFFSLCSLPFDYHDTEDSPAEWHRFLESLWPDDPESIYLLQSWFGYCLLPDLRMQKILLMCGPKRSGKGTIARVLRQALGPDNVAGPSLAGIASQFGLECLIGKTLATISDARLSGRTDKAIVVERLLSISGEDAISVPRKHIVDWTGKLGCKLMLFSNELPALNDISGALASRFMVLMMKKSFYGIEDVFLDRKLAAELPGIVHWAIEGWKKLTKCGRFDQPKSSMEAIEIMESLSSPIAAFLRDKCVIRPGILISIKYLWDEWKKWASEIGREHIGTLQTFGRDIKSCLPNLKTIRRQYAGIRQRCLEGIALRDADDDDLPFQEREPGEDG